MLDTFQSFTTAFADLAWGPWLLWLLLGGGFYFLVRARFTPFRYLGHAIDLLRGGRIDRVREVGDKLLAKRVGDRVHHPFDVVVEQASGK